MNKDLSTFFTTQTITELPIVVSIVSQTPPSN